MGLIKYRRLADDGNNSTEFRFKNQSKMMNKTVIETFRQAEENKKSTKPVSILADLVKSCNAQDYEDSIVPTIQNCINHIVSFKTNSQGLKNSSSFVVQLALISSDLCADVLDHLFSIMDCSSSVRTRAMNLITRIGQAIAETSDAFQAACGDILDELLEVACVRLWDATAAVRQDAIQVYCTYAPDERMFEVVALLKVEQSAGVLTQGLQIFPFTPELALFTLDMVQHPTPAVRKAAVQCASRLGLFPFTKPQTITPEAFTNFLYRALHDKDATVRDEASMLVSAAVREAHRDPDPASPHPAAEQGVVRWLQAIPPPAVDHRWDHQPLWAVLAAFVGADLAAARSTVANVPVTLRVSIDQRCAPSRLVLALLRVVMDAGPGGAGLMGDDELTVALVDEFVTFVSTSFLSTDQRLAYYPHVCLAVDIMVRLHVHLPDPVVREAIGEAVGRVLALPTPPPPHADKALVAALATLWSGEWPGLAPIVSPALSHPAISHAALVGTCVLRSLHPAAADPDIRATYDRSIAAMGAAPDGPTAHRCIVFIVTAILADAGLRAEQGNLMIMLQLAARPADEMPLKAAIAVQAGLIDLLTLLGTAGLEALTNTAITDSRAFDRLGGSIAQIPGVRVEGVANDKVILRLIHGMATLLLSNGVRVGLDGRDARLIEAFLYSLMTFLVVPDQTMGRPDIKTAATAGIIALLRTEHFPEAQREAVRSTIVRKLIQSAREQIEAAGSVDMDRVCDVCHVARTVPIPGYPEPLNAFVLVAISILKWVEVDRLKKAVSVAWPLAMRLLEVGLPHASPVERTAVRSIIKSVAHSCEVSATTAGKMATVRASIDVASDETRRAARDLLETVFMSQMEDTYLSDEENVTDQE